MTPQLPIELIEEILILNDEFYLAYNLSKYAAKTIFNKQTEEKKYELVMKHVKDGNLEMVKFFHKIAYFETNRNKVIEKLDTDLDDTDLDDTVPYISDYGSDDSLDSNCLFIDEASNNGHLDIVVYLHEVVGEKCTKNTMEWACINGHLDIVKFLHEVVGEKCTQYEMRWACSNGHLDIVVYLYEVVGVECTPWAMNYASENGHLEVIRYLHETVGVGCTVDAMNYASENGHLEVIQYLHETVGSGCTVYAMNWASKNGHLEVVKYLHEVVGAECSMHAMKWASSRSHLKIVKYLHETVGVGYTTDAIGGNLSITGTLTANIAHSSLTGLTSGDDHTQYTLHKVIGACCTTDGV